MPCIGSAFIGRRTRKAATPLRRVPRLINAPHHEARTFSPYVGILDELWQYIRDLLCSHQRLTFFSYLLTFNMRIPFAETVYQWCSRDFFQTRRELYSFRHRFQDLKNLETETFIFRFRAATSFELKRAFMRRITLTWDFAVYADQLIFLLTFATILPKIRNR
jgi:hypothetical protein